MRLFSNFILLATFALILISEKSMSQTSDKENWVGLQFTDVQEIPYFKDIIGNSSRLLPNRSYAISDHVKKDNHFVFLERLLTTGPKRFKILQVLNVGSLKSDEIMDISGGCKLNGKDDAYIIAIVKMDSDKEIFKNIRKAWKVSLKDHRFIPISPKNISCINEGYGL